MGNVVAFLFFFSLVLGLGPVLGLTGFLAAVFFVAKESVAMWIMLIFFVVGLVARVTIGFGVRLG